MHDALLYKRLLLQARRYWLHIVGLFLVSLLATPLALLGPVPLRIAVDCVIGSKPLPALLHRLAPDALQRSRPAILICAVVLVVLTALLSQLQGLAANVLRTWTAERLVQDFRARLFRHVQRISLLYHDTHGSSDAAYRIQRDASSIQDIAIDGVIPFVTSAVTLGSMLAVMLHLDWQLALVAVAVTPLIGVLARIYRNRLRQRSREVRRLESEAQGVVYEVLSALRVVKAFGQEERELDRFVTTSLRGVRERIRLAVAQGRLGLFVGMTTAGGTAVMLYLGARHVQSGVLTLGELLLVMSYLGQLYEPLKTTSRKIAGLQGDLASAERAFALLDQEPDVPEKPHARRLARARGDVVFAGVTFAYDPGQPVLRQVSFEVPAGACVGIAGRTGVGKSTLLSLMTRFFDPLEGRILLDGVDIADYKVADLRHQFAIVLQEPVLFSTSLAENIAYANPGATAEEIVAAARAANAHDFIAALPQGYDTLVGERGMRLSGGERQRIALARAFLKDAPILILDEPTSSVDTATEAGILEAMQRLMQNRTTFMVAHRLGTLQGCDLLLQIEDGGRASIRRNGAGKEQDALALGGLQAEPGADVPR
jgi:ATP-binding cassette, subfamily B, bacterial